MRDTEKNAQWKSSAAVQAYPINSEKARKESREKAICIPKNMQVNEGDAGSNRCVHVCTPENQKLLRRVVDYYRSTLRKSPPALEHLHRRGITGLGEIDGHPAIC
mgnify:CR=1 FL=1